MFFLLTNYFLYARIFLVIHSKGGQMARKSRVIGLFEQRESLKKAWRETINDIDKLRRKADGLRSKLRLIEDIDEFWDGVPVHIDINDKRTYSGCVSLVDEKGFIQTVRYVYVNYHSNGRGNLRSYEISIHERTGVTSWSRESFDLGPKKVSEVKAIVREWITKGTINGKDPKVK
jgi:hypothetical protein